MEVAPVDEGQADLGIDAEAARRVQAGEPATDDDDAMERGGGVGLEEGKGEREGLVVSLVVSSFSKGGVATEDPSRLWTALAGRDRAALQESSATRRPDVIQIDTRHRFRTRLVVCATVIAVAAAALAVGSLTASSPGRPPERTSRNTSCARKAGSLMTASGRIAVDRAAGHERPQRPGEEDGGVQLGKPSAERRSSAGGRVRL